MSEKSLDGVIDQLKHNVKLAIGSMETDANGDVSMTVPELGITILAAAFGLAMTLGVTTEQLQQVITRCMHAPEAAKPTIILA